MRLLDTDICIDLLKKYPPTATWFATLTEPAFIPGFVALELYQGCRDKREAAEVEKFLRRFSIVWPLPTACATMLADFPTARLSHSLGILHALIGACALELDATVCTFNVNN